MNIQFNNSDSINSNHVRITNNNIENSQRSESEFDDSEEEENSIVSLNMDSEREAVINQENEEEAYREFLLQKRNEVIEDLNVFQFKHAEKFITRKEE